MFIDCLGMAESTKTKRIKSTELSDNGSFWDGSETSWQNTSHLLGSYLLSV